MASQLNTSNIWRYDLYQNEICRGESFQLNLEKKTRTITESKAEDNYHVKKQASDTSQAEVASLLSEEDKLVD